MKCPRAFLGPVWTAAILAALFCALPAQAAGDLSGPVVVGSHPNTPLVGMDLPTGSLYYDYYYEHDTTKQAGISSGTTDTRMEEELNLLTNGYVLSPNLLDLRLGALIGLQQEDFSEPGQDRYSDDLLDGWDVAGTLLRNGSAPLTLYTRRDQQILTPDFSPSLNSVDTNSGATLDIHSDSAPTQIQIYHDENTQTQAGDVLNYQLTQDVGHWHTEVINLPNQSLVWDFNYQDTTEQELNSPAIHYTDYDASLSHVLNFGPRLADSLSSLMSFSDQVGNLGYQEFSLDENMQLQHSPDLQTHYTYTLDTTSVAGIQQTNNKLDLGFVHHLFESLTTTADAGASLFSESGSGDIWEYFGTVNFGYRKTIPAGLLLSNLNFGYQWQNAAEGTQTIHVLNQPFTFSDPQPLTLTQTNIDAGSIKVLSAGGVPYLKTQDFTVNRVGNLIQIERVVGGLIPPDATVKVDYNLLPQPASTINTGTLGANARYEIEQGPLAGLAPYIRYGLQRQSIETTSPGSFVADSYNDLTVGSDYRIWKFLFNGEQEWRDSTLVPFNATRFSARYVDQFSRTATASLTGSYANIDYYGEKDLVNDASITAAVEERLNTEWSVTARVVYLNDRDQLFGNTEGLEEQLEVDWTHNQTSVFARVRNATLTTEAEQNTFQVFEFGISRKF